MGPSRFREVQRFCCISERVEPERTRWTDKEARGSLFVACFFLQYQRRDLTFVSCFQSTSEIAGAPAKTRKQLQGTASMSSLKGRAESRYLGLNEGQSHHPAALHLG